MAGVVCLGTALVPALALAQGSDGDRQDIKFGFTTAKADAPTGLKLEIDYMNPDDPDSKPPAVRSVIEKLARRARIDTSAPQLCTATDAELMASGAEACPGESEVGTGVLTLDTGIPGPTRFITADVVFLNNTDELIFVNTLRDGGGRVVVRSAVRGRRTYVNKAPFLPGIPPDGTAIDTVDVSFPVTRNEQGDSYITTPTRCPERGFRSNRIEFTYDDGVSQTERDRWRCAEGAA